MHITGTLSSRIMRRLAQFMRLCASVCVCLHLCASVCVWLSLCVCVRLAQFMRLCASVCVCVRLCASACICVRLCASGSVYASVCVCLHLCASGSVYASVCVCVRLCASACGNWLILCVCLRRSSFKEFKGGGNWLRCSGFAVCLVSYYPLAVSYNVPMLKYPSHHLIYVFYHPMPIMPLY